MWIGEERRWVWGASSPPGAALQGPLDPEALPLWGPVAGCWEKEEPPLPFLLSRHPVVAPPARSLDLTGPLLLGGVPDLPESFPVRTRHFVGCMRNLQVDSRHVDMADFIANNGTEPGM